MATNGSIANHPTQRVLIIFPGALGDLICLGPAVSAIARRHPGAEIELMAREELANFAVGRLGATGSASLGIRRAHSIDRREVALLFSESPTDGLEQSRRFFEVFERIYCFFSSEDARFRRALIEASMPGAPTFHRFRPSGDGHVALEYLKDVTGEATAEEVALNFPAHDLEAATRAIWRVAEPKKFVAIFPGSGSPSKNWPIEKFAALASRLKEETRAIFILGPAEDRLEDLLIENGLNILKKLSLGTVAAIARMASAFVGNDSGVSHLAAAAGTPGVVLFGPTEPERWHPMGRAKVIRRKPIGDIEPSEVVSALRTLRHRAS